MRNVESRGSESLGCLRGGSAVAAAFDEGVETGDEGPDVLVQGLLPFEERAGTFRNSAESLLEFEVLLADTEVELGKPLVVEPVGLAEEPNHLLAGFPSR